MLKVIFFFIACLSASFICVADTVYTDDGIIQGNTCIGIDCSSDMTFTTPPLVLKENNLKIKLEVSTLNAESIELHSSDYYYIAEFGNSWNLDANDSANGGQNYFALEQSYSKTPTLLSDGTAVNYRCFYYTNDAEVYNVNQSLIDSGIVYVNADGVIPRGEPIKTPQCGTSTAPVPVKNGVKLLEDASINDGGIALGFNSTASDANVSVGMEDQRRRLVNIAYALNDIDVLALGQMTVYVDQVTTIDTLNKQLDKLEAQIVKLESLSTQNSSSDDHSGGAFSIFWLLLLGGFGVLRIKLSTRAVN